MRILGGDPGASGAFTLVCPALWHGAKVYKLAKVTRQGYLEVVQQTVPDIAYVEKVAPMPARDSKGKPRKVGTKSMFTFGAYYERMLMALAAHHIPVIDVPPREWQKGVGLVFPKGSTYSERKHLARELAESIYGIKIPLDVADSMLIAEYGKRCHANTV